VEWRAENPDKKFVMKNIPIPPIDLEEVFHKGVDYFVEILMFYGLLGSLGIYELRKSILAGQ
jgi:hypothetical protein